MTGTGTGTSDRRFELRAAIPQDEPFLFVLYCSTRADEIAPFGWDPIQQQAFLDLQFRARERHYQVQALDVDRRIIMLGELPIGELIVMRSSAEIRLADIALLPAQRGQGIGSSVIRGLFDEARLKEVPVTLHVEKASRARGLYDNLGFAVTSETGSHYKMEWHPAVAVTRNKEP